MCFHRCTSKCTRHLLILLMFQLACDSKTTVFPFPSPNQPSPNSYRTFSFINKASWCPRCGFPRFPSSLPCIFAGSPLQFPTGTVCLPTSRRLSSILLTHFFFPDSLHLLLRHALIVPLGSWWRRHRPAELYCCGGQSLDDKRWHVPKRRHTTPCECKQRTERGVRS